MQQIGRGGFQHFDAGTGIPKRPVVYLNRLAEDSPLLDSGLIGPVFLPMAEQKVLT